MQRKAELERALVAVEVAELLREVGALERPERDAEVAGVAAGTLDVERARDRLELRLDADLRQVLRDQVARVDVELRLDWQRELELLVVVVARGVEQLLCHLAVERLVGLDLAQRQRQVGEDEREVAGDGAIAE